MNIEPTGNPAIDEAIEIIEIFANKTSIYGPTANCKMIVLPDFNSGSSILVFTIYDTIIYKIPLKNQINEPYGAGSGVHKYGLNIFDKNILDELYQKFIFYEQFSNINLPLAQDDELRNNDEFEELLALKSAQGLKYYHLPDLNNPGNCYLIPMFAGFLKLNKGDTVGVKIYDLDQLNHLFKFNIYKKKINRNLDIYCRALKI